MCRRTTDGESGSSSPAFMRRASCTQRGAMARHANRSANGRGLGVAVAEPTAAKNAAAEPAAVSATCLHRYAAPGTLRPAAHLHAGKLARAMAREERAGPWMAEPAYASSLFLVRGFAQCFMGGSMTHCPRTAVPQLVRPVRPHVPLVRTYKASHTALAAVSRRCSRAGHTKAARWPGPGQARLRRARVRRGVARESHE